MPNGGEAKQTSFFSSPQTSTPLIVRQSNGKKPFVIEPTTPPPRVARRAETQCLEELSKSNPSGPVKQRKHSANSISPISTASSIIKKRSRKDSPVTKSQGKTSSKKRKESQTEDEQSDDHDESAHVKRKLHLDLSSKWLGKLDSSSWLI